MKLCITYPQTHLAAHDSINENIQKVLPQAGNFNLMTFVRRDKDIKDNKAFEDFLPARNIRKNTLNLYQSLPPIYKQQYAIHKT